MSIDPCLVDTFSGLKHWAVRNTPVVWAHNSSIMSKIITLGSVQWRSHLNITLICLLKMSAYSYTIIQSPIYLMNLTFSIETGVNRATAAVIGFCPNGVRQHCFHTAFSSCLCCSLLALYVPVFASFWWCNLDVWLCPGALRICSQMVLFWFSLCCCSVLSQALFSWFPSPVNIASVPSSGSVVMWIFVLQPLSSCLVLHMGSVAFGFTSSMFSGSTSWCFVVWVQMGPAKSVTGLFGSVTVSCFSTGLSLLDVLLSGTDW